MKLKSILCVVFAATLLGSCSYDDGDLWDAVNGQEERISALDDEGRLIPRSKVRGKKKVIQEIVKRMEENAQDGLDYSGKCYISQSACMEDAEAVARLVEERFPKLDGKVEINYIGTTIGSHTGPGTVALFFWGKRRQG